MAPAILGQVIGAGRHYSCYRSRQIQRDPEVLSLAKCFLEVRGAKAKIPHMFKNIVVVWPCRRRRQGQKTLVSGKVRLFCLRTQGLHNFTWPKKHFGIPLIRCDLRTASGLFVDFRSGIWIPRSLASVSFAAALRPEKAQGTAEIPVGNQISAHKSNRKPRGGH